LSPEIRAGLGKIVETAVRKSPAEETVDELLEKIRRDSFGSLLDEKDALVRLRKLRKWA